MAIIGYFENNEAVVTTDVLAVVNTATQELEGDVIWHDFEYEDSTESGGKTIQIFGTCQDQTEVTYRLVVARNGDDLITIDDEAPCYTTCSNLLDCAQCRISVAGSCYCKIPSGNAECGFCSQKNLTWMDISGGFANYCNARF